MTPRRARQIGFLAGVGVFSIVALYSTRSLFFIVPVLVVATVGMMMLGQRSLDGDLRILSLGRRIRSRLARVARWDDFDPELEAQPWLMPKMRLVGLPHDSSDIGVIEYTDAMVVAFEVSGSGEGVRSWTELRRIDKAWAGLHVSLMEGKRCVDQLDWYMVIRPENVGEAIALADSKLAPSCNDALRDSALEVAARTAARAESHRSFVVARFNVDRLYRYGALPPFTKESGVQAAQVKAEQLVGLLRSAGISVSHILSPEQLVAFKRAVLDPSASVDDLSNCESLWKGQPAWKRSADGLSLRITPQTGDVWHTSTACFSREDWPNEAVESRWLARMVLGTGEQQPLGPRVIVSQMRILSPAMGRKVIRSQKTTAAGRLHKASTEGAAVLDEEDVALATASVVAADILRSGAAGIIPSVRIMVSARTERELTEARESVESIAHHSTASGITWDDERPGPGLLHVLPLGMEVTA